MQQHQELAQIALRPVEASRGSQWVGKPVQKQHSTAGGANASVVVLEINL